MTKHLRILHPAAGIQAFYDGRVDGYRFAAGAELGRRRRAVARHRQLCAGRGRRGADLRHACLRALRALDPRRGWKPTAYAKFTVVLSHWHLDHVAGTAAFADCEIIANRRTMQHLTRHKAAIEAGTHHGPPAIDPLILPTRLFDGQMQLDARRPRNPADRAQYPQRRRHRHLAARGAHPAGRRHAGGHSHLCRRAREFRSPHRGPGAALGARPAFILPNHGDADVIGAGGYSKMLIRATQDYIKALQRAVHDPALRTLGLRELLAPCGRCDPILRAI